jgi:hypothetical protein
MICFREMADLHHNWIDKCACLSPSLLFVLANGCRKLQERWLKRWPRQSTEGLLNQDLERKTLDCVLSTSATRKFSPGLASWEPRARSRTYKMYDVNVRYNPYRHVVSHSWIKCEPWTFYTQQPRHDNSSTTDTRLVSLTKYFFPTKWWGRNGVAETVLQHPSLPTSRILPRTSSFVPNGHFDKVFRRCVNIYPLLSTFRR